MHSSALNLLMSRLNGEICGWNGTKAHVLGEIESLKFTIIGEIV